MVSAFGYMQLYTVGSCKPSFVFSALFPLVLEKNRATSQFRPNPPNPPNPPHHPIPPKPAKPPKPCHWYAMRARATCTPSTCPTPVSNFVFPTLLTIPNPGNFLLAPSSVSTQHRASLGYPSPHSPLLRFSASSLFPLLVLWVGDHIRKILLGAVFRSQPRSSTSHFHQSSRS